MEKLTYDGKFSTCNSVADKVLGTRDMLRSIGSRVNKPLRIFCNNKRIVLAVHSANMLIKKQSNALAFYRTRGFIASRAIEL